MGCFGMDLVETFKNVVSFSKNTKKENLLKGGIWVLVVGGERVSGGMR